MNPLIKNYFEAEGALVARLNKAMPTLAGVFTPFSIGDMIEASQPSPACHVIYNGDSVTGNEVGSGSARVISQRWLIVLAVRAPRAQLQQTGDVRSAAGALIPALLASVQGWQATQWLRPFVRVNGPAVGYSPAFAYFPFLFEARLII